MATLPRVTEVWHLGARVIRVAFSDGLVREFDFAAALHGHHEPASSPAARVVREYRLAEAG